MSNSSVFVLDFDGVITSLDIDWSRLRGEVSNVLGVKITTFLDFFETTWGTPVFSRASEMVKEHELEAAHRAKPYPDVASALEILRQKKNTAYIASMQSNGVLDYFLGAHNLLQYFKETLGRESAGSKRRQLEHIAQIEGLSANAVFIDDSRKHVATGKELGFRSIYFRRGSGSPTLEELIISESV